MSKNTLNKDAGNKNLNSSQTDKDFDFYWEQLSRIPVRNRMRIGRRFQASIPPLMKPNEVDERKSEIREFLKWSPENVINEQQLEQYLQLAKAVAMFSKVVKNEDSTINNSLTKKDETGNNQHLESVKDEKTEDKNELNNQNALNKFKLIFKSLSQFVDAHHPLQGDSNCELISKSKNYSTNSKDKSDDKLVDKSESNDDELNYIPKSNWTEKECILFAAALEICSKNFSSIKKEFLPFKSSKNIIDYYNLCLNQQDKADNSDLKLSLNEDEIKKCNELRNKLDARSADGKDANLEQCFAYLNQFINELMKQNVDETKELNKKYQSNSKDNDSNDDNSPSNSSNGGSLNNSSSNSLSKNSKTNSSKTNSKSSKNNGETKEENNNEKKSSKNLKQNQDNKRSSLRTSNKTNQLNQTIEPINQQTKKEEKSAADVKDEYEFDDKTESECNSLGSLKFYKDGQLVLKLNNKFIDNKTKWEESKDSIELNKMRKNLKKRKEASRSRKSLEQNGKPNSKMLPNECESSECESDNDSRTSSEHSLFNKKAKVKVETNYYLPLPSTDLKEEDFGIDLRNSGLTKLINNEDNLKRKPRSPKTTNSKKSKILKNNECANKLNSSPNLIEQLNSLSKSSRNQNQLVDQLNLLSSLPLELQKKLIEANLNPNQILDFEKNQNVNNLNFLSNLSNLTDLNDFNSNQQQNLIKLLTSFSEQSEQQNAFGNIGNIDSIKLQNQIECLSTLNSLIEQFK